MTKISDKMKQKHEKHASEDEETQKRRKQNLELEQKLNNMRKEMVLIRKSVGAKQIKDESLLERQGISIQWSELKSGTWSKIYKAKHTDNENLICKVLILEKLPAPYRQNLDLSFKIQRYMCGGATDPNSPKGGSEPKNAGLVKILDIFTTDQKAYVFMEEVGVKSLIDSKFKRADSPDENEVKKAVRELAQILQYLHSSGVAHNNVRSSHVVSNKEDQLKLIGMNLCGFYWDTVEEGVLLKKKISKKEFEKHCHLPPEAFKEETYDPSLADIWGLGVVMCQMIAKENPFKIKSEQPFEEQWKAFALTKQFSNEAKQFLDRIFVEPQNRPNITDILEDSYLKSAGSASSTPKASKGSAAEKEGSSDRGAPPNKNASAESAPPAAPATPDTGADASEEPPKS